MTLVLDAMGSDTHPQPEVAGAIRAAQEFGEEILLSGDEHILRPLLAEAGSPGTVRIVHAPDAIGMQDKPVEASRAKPDNSMAVGLRLVKSGEARAFVTMGNTGAAWFSALRNLGRIAGVDRAPLAPVLPTRAGSCILVDSGANVDSRPEFLHQFAQLASVYAKIVFQIAQPRVGLLSNGEEEEKGDQLVRSAHALLVADPNLRFIGNVEPRQVFAGEVDVLVADGFAGNVFLKSSEAVAAFLLSTLRETLETNLAWKVGGALARPAFRKVRQMLNPSDVGGAVLLGVDGLVLIGHGHSDAKAVYNALRYAHQCAELNLTEQIKVAFSAVNKE